MYLLICRELDAALQHDYEQIWPCDTRIEQITCFRVVSSLNGLRAPSSPVML